MAEDSAVDRAAVINKRVANVLNCSGLLFVFWPPVISSAIGMLMLHPELNLLECHYFGIKAKWDSDCKLEHTHINPEWLHQAWDRPLVGWMCVLGCGAVAAIVFICSGQKNESTVAASLIFIPINSILLSFAETCIGAGLKYQDFQNNEYESANISLEQLIQVTLLGSLITTFVYSIYSCWLMKATEEDIVAEERASLHNTASEPLLFAALGLRRNSIVSDDLEAGSDAQINPLSVAAARMTFGA